MEHPKDIGDRSALAIAIALQGIGHAVYLPFGENTRADFIIDDGTRLARVQCKTGRLRKGVVQFKTCSSYAHHSNPGSVARDYLGQIEYFAGQMRVTHTNKKQNMFFRGARLFEIGRVGIHATDSFRELGRVDEVGG